MCLHPGAPFIGGMVLSLIALAVALTIRSSDVKKSEVEEALAAPLLQGARPTAACRLLRFLRQSIPCAATAVMHNSNGNRGCHLLVREAEGLQDMTACCLAPGIPCRRYCHPL